MKKFNELYESIINESIDPSMVKVISANLALITDKTNDKKLHKKFKQIAGTKFYDEVKKLWGIFPVDVIKRNLNNVDPKVFHHISDIVKMDVTTLL
jgi:hypothetical protein